MVDAKNFPINYNHYYTDTVSKQRQDRQKAALKECIGSSANATVFRAPSLTSSDVVERIVAKFHEQIDPSMENFSCEEAIDCLLAIYKVSPKSYFS